MEKRSVIRYKLSLPVIFKWTDADGRSFQKGGFTRDISTRGLYICCPDLPPINAVLSLEILLPPNKNIMSESLKLAATVDVVRVGIKPEERGFAAEGSLAMQVSEYVHQKAAQA